MTSYANEAQCRAAIDTAYNQAKMILNRVQSEKRDIRPDEQAEFDRLDAVGATARAAMSSFQSRGRKTADNVADYATADMRSQSDMALRAWALGNRASREQIEAAERVGLRYGAQELDVRALSVGTNTAGGSSVADELMQGFWEAEKWFGQVRAVATTLTSTTGAPLPVPTVDDTTNTGEIVAEAGAVTTTADPTFGSLVLRPFKYSSKAVIVSVELLQDSSINLAQYLGRALGERIGRIQNTHFTVGAGTTLPFGVATQASLGKTAAATNAITFDECIDLFASVDPAYQAKPGFAVMMHPNTATSLRKVKDSQNRYLWEMSLQTSGAERLFGHRVILNSDMDEATATNKRVVLAGDFSTYLIDDAGPTMFIRDDSIRVLNHQVVFLAYKRSDGGLTNTSAVKYLRTA